MDTNETIGQLFNDFNTETTSYCLGKKQSRRMGPDFVQMLPRPDISAEVYNFKEANEVLENQVKNCDVEKVKTEPELMNTKL
jgi:hypothetical protein